VMFVSPCEREYPSRPMPPAWVIRGLRSHSEPDDDSEPDRASAYWEPDTECWEPTSDDTWTWRDRANFADSRHHGDWTRPPDPGPIDAGPPLSQPGQSPPGPPAPARSASPARAARSARARSAPGWFA
jgi:hypothetical protein